MKYIVALIGFSFVFYHCSGQNKLPKITADSIYLGLTMGQIIMKFGLDTSASKSMIIEEPPGIVRGIETELPDSSFLFLQVNRKWFGGSYCFVKDLLNEKIIGIGIAYKDCIKKAVGEGFIWFGISNPHCYEK